MLEAGRSRVPDSTRWINFLNSHNLSAAIGPEVHSASNKNEYQKQKNKYPGGRVWPVRRADKLSAICKATVQNMWDPQHLPIIQTSSVGYRHSFTLLNDMQQTEWRDVSEIRLLHLQVWRISQAKRAIIANCVHYYFLLGLFFWHEYGSPMFLRNVGWLSTLYAALYPTGQKS
jgi:hypothetical protein